MKNEILEWSDELATGILWQDFQHAELIAHINGLQKAILAKQAQAELWRMIDFLEKYVENHFGIEEHYMEAADDPAAGEHIQAHQQFCENLAALRNYDGTGAQIKAASLCYDLYEWVTNHIRTTDKALGRLLQQKALQ